MRNIVQDGAKKVNPRAGKCAIIPLVLHTREGENLNESTHTQSRRKRRIGWLIFAAVLLAAVVGVWLYLSDYYRADKTAVAALQDYERQKAAGKDPVFRERNIGLSNTDVWK